MGYKFLDHTADVKFIAEEKTLESAFIESAYALKETICGDIGVLGQDKKNLEIKGTNLENLLYKFLEEFIFLLDAEDFLISKIDSLEIDETTNTLKARISGDNASNYKFTNDVKAITYSEMKIEKDKDKDIWKIIVVLDV